MEPTVWGERPDLYQCPVNMPHEWGDMVEQQRGGAYSGKVRWQHIADEANEQGVPVRTVNPEAWGLVDGHPPVASGQFCRRCGAWLGALGLEPTPELFVTHIVEVFREVRRVLRKDGTLWLNIGDSYAASGRNAGNTNGTAASTLNTRQQEHSKVSRVVRGSTLPAGFHEKARENGVIGRAWQGAPDGYKPKDLVGIPWMVAFALRADGWWLRQDIIWSKPNPMPESVRDRCTKAHEYLFLLTKSERYYSNFDAIREPATGLERDQIEARSQRVSEGNKSLPTEMVNGIRKRSGNKERKPASARGVPVDTNGSTNGAVAGSVPWEGDSRNKRSVWHIPTAPFPEAHFATFPPALVEPCILAGSRAGDVVLDPFLGSGTTAMVAKRLGRRAVGIDLNPDYLSMAVRRCAQQGLIFEEVS